MIRSFFHTLFHLIWSVFISGLLTILPLTLTIALFNVSFKLLKGWLEPVARLKPHFLDWIPHAEILIVLAFVLLIGTLLNLFLARSILHAFEELVARTPLVRPLYSGIKQLINAFSMQDKDSFKSVVIVEYPRKGIYSIGFLTGELPQPLQPKQGAIYVSVFVPTTPNPTSGFLIMVPHDEIQQIDLTRQEAMALIISGGIIMPDKFTSK